MQHVLVLGAGHSAPFLIRTLLDRAEALDLQVTVGDLDVEAARRRVADHPRGRAIAFDLADEAACKRHFSEADVVVSLLPPFLQPDVARHAIAHRCHMVSASYRSREMRQLGAEAAQQGVVILCELGLDPGIDVMSAQQIIDQVHAAGGRIDAFESYGGGLPEPTFDGNPLRYVVTWNPRNVAMAGEAGSCFQRRGRVQLLPPHRVFSSHWTIDVPELGAMDAYGNRDALSYREVHSLQDVHTLVRGTLRYPGYCHFWQQIVELGLANEKLEVPDLGKMSWRQYLEMFLPSGDGPIEARTAQFLDLDPQDPALKKLDWLGLFSDQPIDISGLSPCQALTALLERRLPLPPEHRDMVVLHHAFEVTYPDRREKILSTFVHYGDAGGMTAMSQTVGLPAALGVELLLVGNPVPPGVHVPVSPDLYRPIMTGLAEHGMTFIETVQEMA